MPDDQPQPDYDLVPVDHDPFVVGPVAKPGQTIAPPAVRQDITAMPGKVANVAGDVTGVNDAISALKGNMTPEEAQNFALMSAAGLVAPELRGARAAMGAAEEVAPPFYSALENAVANAKMNAAPGSQWLGFLKNAQGVKPEEIGWLGVDDFLKNQQRVVPKQALADYIANNKVGLQEVEKGRTISGAEAKARLASDPTENIYTATGAGPLEDDQIRDTGNYLLSGQGPKFRSYTLPGGENYRELLLTLPERGERGPMPFEEWARLSGHDDTPEARYEYRYSSASGERNPSQENYRSSHWDEPNVLAHVRFDDREIDGDKTLHLAEIQSDWHQQGRKRGYDDPIARAVVETKLNAAGYPISGEDARLAADNGILTQEEAQLLGNRSYVPDAPFKTTWPELALKRMIRYAAENGYDRISWDTGATNADRYDLSKQISRLTLTGDVAGKPYLAAYDKGGNQVMTQYVENPEKDLPDIIGKEAADKILNKEPNTAPRIERVSAPDFDVTSRENDWLVKAPDGRSIEIGKGTEPTEGGARLYAMRYLNNSADVINRKRMAGVPIRELSGLDLKVGGEGMKGFYDQILPTIANKLVKKFGARVGEEKITTRPAKSYEDFVRQHDQAWPETPRDQLPQIYENYKFGVEGKTPVHTIELTPQLKKAAMTQGFPLFKHGGAVSGNSEPYYLQPVDYIPQFVDESRRASGGAVDPCAPNDKPESQTNADWLMARQTAEVSPNDPIGPRRNPNDGRADGGSAPDPYESFRPSTNVEDARNESVPEKLYDNFMMNVTGQKDNWISDISNEIQGKPTVSQREKAQVRAGGGRVLPVGLSAEFTGIPLNRWGIYGKDGTLLATGKTRDEAIENLTPKRAHGGRVESRNINHNPTPAQAKSGAYAKDHLYFRGLPLTIENAKGSVRHGIGKDGKSWSAQMPKNAHYGYIKRTQGADHQHVDIFLGPHVLAPNVFVVDQVDPDTGKFDEHKVLAGFFSQRQALNAYERAFSDGKARHRIGSVTQLSIEQFKDWLKNGNTAKPIGHVRAAA